MKMMGSDSGALLRERKKNVNKPWRSFDTSLAARHMHIFSAQSRVTSRAASRAARRWKPVFHIQRVVHIYNLVLYNKKQDL